MGIGAWGVVRKGFENEETFRLGFEGGVGVSQSRREGHCGRVNCVYKGMRARGAMVHVGNCEVFGLNLKRGK